MEEKELESNVKSSLEKDHPINMQFSREDIASLKSLKNNRMLKKKIYGTLTVRKLIRFAVQRFIIAVEEQESKEKKEGDTK